jgi:hypothetical protein
MVILGDKAQVEAHFGPFGDSVSVGVSLVNKEYHQARPK